MAQARVIFHVDMDAFFASIAQRDDPSLRGKAVLVGGDGPRGVVTAASYEARESGCRSAMPMSQAKRLCPHAQVVGVPGEAIRAASARLFELLGEFSPLVEPVSVDEAFVDMTGTERLLGPIDETARRLKCAIRDQLRLNASVGVAPNKFLAKLASDHNKPDGLCIVTADQASDWLAAVPVSRMWGIGRVGEKRMRDRGIRTIGDLRDMPDEWMSTLFGEEADRYRRLSRGIDDRPVVPDHEAKSIGHEQTFGSDLADPEAVRSVMLDQCEQVGRRLRKRHLKAGRMTVKIRFGDFKTITRSATLAQRTDTTADLYESSLGLFDAWAARSFQPVRLIGCSAGQLSAETGQEGLFGGEQSQRDHAVDEAMDAIAERFGKRAVTRAGAMRRDGRRPGLS